MTLRLAGLLALAAALVLVVAAPGSARPDSVVVVAGQATTNDNGTPNDPNDDYNNLSGSLVGAQYTTSEDFRYDPLTGTVIAWGTEHFDGCLDRNRNRTCGAGDTVGTLDFAFIYWAELDPSTGALRTGMCVHPITGGSGGFTGAQGTLTMKDTPLRDGRVLTTYIGKLSLTGAPSSSRIAPSSARTLSSANAHSASAQAHAC